MTRGKFIVFEGLDGAGTSTQIELLAGYLRDRGIEVATSREPTDGAAGSLIRRVLRKEIDVDPAALALLFAADRVDHLERPDGVKAALEAGRWLLSDRYVLSSVAYQAADGLDAGWVVAINRQAIAPDLTIYVEADPEVCMRRITARGARPERFETTERLRAVEQQFRAHLGDAALTGELMRIDGNGSVEAVEAEIRTKIGGWLKEFGNA